MCATMSISSLNSILYIKAQGYSENLNLFCFISNDFFAYHFYLCISCLFPSYIHHFVPLVSKEFVCVYVCICVSLRVSKFAFQVEHYVKEHEWDFLALFNCRT